MIVFGYADGMVYQYQFKQTLHGLDNLTKIKVYDDLSRTIHSMVYD